jgi:2-polyprenyl-3-methyl-5-hydroxy-6-metoxy-1,4-benzoquinol methylase
VSGAGASGRDTADLYARVVDEEAGDSLAKLARRIRPGTAVFDVGTAGGALGEYLGRRKGCVVDGVERDLGAAALARRHYRRLVVADLDASDPVELAPPKTYDYVVCADVLEHLRDPERVLASLHALLREGGQLLISIPNAGYAPFLAELLDGQLRYRPVGLLDETHLRFVTRSSLERMIAAAGFATVDLERVVKPAHESEFDTRSLEALPPAVRAFLDGAPEAYTYQFIVQAAPRGESLAAAPPAAGDRWPLPLRFVARLYWRPAGSSYRQELQAQALGEIGAGRQTLRFTLPAAAGRIDGLMLEPADRQTLLELHALRVHGPAGPVWSWSGLAEDLRRSPHERITFSDGEGVDAGVQMAIWEREPRLELPLAGVELAGGCTVEAEVGWPPSPEYMRLLESLSPRSAEIGALVAERERLGTLLEERLRLLRQTEAAWAEAVRERDRALLLLDERLELLEAVTRQAQELEAEIHRLVAAQVERAPVDGEVPEAPPAAVLPEGGI